MFISYLENTNLRAEIPRPSFKTLIHFYRGTQLKYADVLNHMLLIEHGYEKIDTRALNFDIKNERRNWVYPPLHPTLARLLNTIVKSPFWSLWVINQLLLLSIFTGFYYWSKANISSDERRFSCWLILFFFILSPLCYFINFIILPAILLAIIFFSLRKWLASPGENKTSFWILTVSSFMIGFSRFQGMLVNASLLILVFIIIIWYKKPLGMERVAILSSANILPFLFTLMIFKYYANDPFAWWKTQSGWGVTFSWPWRPIISYWKSGYIFNLASDDLFFTTFRLLVFSAFAALAVKKIVFKENFIQDFIAHRYHESLISLFFIAISFGLLLLPFLTDILVAAHRLMTLAFLIIVIWFEQRGRINVFLILLLIFVRAVEFTLFFQGVRAFIW
jgi:hypothetical protein